MCFSDKDIDNRLDRTDVYLKQLRSQIGEWKLIWEMQMKRCHFEFGREGFMWQQLLVPAPRHPKPSERLYLLKETSPSAFPGLSRMQLFFFFFFSMLFFPFLWLRIFFPEQNLLPSRLLTIFKHNDGVAETDVAKVVSLPWAQRCCPAEGYLHRAPRKTLNTAGWGPGQCWAGAGLGKWEASPLVLWYKNKTGIACFW